MKKKYIKTIASCMCVVLLILSVLIVAKDRLPKKETGNSNKNDSGANNDTDAEYIKEPEVTTDADGFMHVKLNSGQIYDNTQPVVIENYQRDGTLSESIEYVISDATVSRALKEEYRMTEEGKAYFRKYYDWDSLYSDEEETFREGTAFYMYIDVVMTNRHSQTIDLGPSNLAMMAIDYKDGVYEGTQCVWQTPKFCDYATKWGFSNHASRYKQTAGEPFFDEGLTTVVRYYETGESVSYTLVFRVPEEYIISNNIYLNTPRGNNYGRYMSDINQKYIKVNIVNRGDYFETTN